MTSATGAASKLKRTTSEVGATSGLAGGESGAEGTALPSGVVEGFVGGRTGPGAIQRAAAIGQGWDEETSIGTGREKVGGGGKQTKAERDIGYLPGIFGRVLRRNRTIWAHEGEVFTAGAEFEIGVERLSGDAAVAIRGKHDQVTASRKIRGRETPLGEVPGVVGQAPVQQVDGGCCPGC